MYRTFKRAEGATVTSNSLVKVFMDNTIENTKGTKSNKGIVPKTIVKSNIKENTKVSSIKVKNKVITVSENYLYLAEYFNGEVHELKNIKLKEVSEYDGNNTSKVFKIDDSRCIVISSVGVPTKGTLSCFIYNVDTDNLGREFIISSRTAPLKFDVAALNENKIIVGYIDNYKDNSIEDITVSAFGKSIPALTTLLIDESNNITMPYQPIYFEFPSEKLINADKIFITKLSNDEFFGTYTIQSDRKAGVYSTVFKLDSQNRIGSYEKFEYKGSYGNWEVSTIRPFHLQENRILTFEYTKSNKFNVVIREIKQDYNGVYSFRDTDSISLSSYSANVSLLRENEDESRDYVMFDRYIVRINSNNDSIELIEEMDSINVNAIEKLENNLLLSFDKNNDFQLLKYNVTSAEPLGFVKGGE